MKGLIVQQEKRSKHEKVLRNQVMKASKMIKILQTKLTTVSEKKLKEVALLKAVKNRMAAQSAKETRWLHEDAMKELQVKKIWRANLKKLETTRANLLSQLKAQEGAIIKLAKRTAVEEEEERRKLPRLLDKARKFQKTKDLLAESVKERRLLRRSEINSRKLVANLRGRSIHLMHELSARQQKINKIENHWRDRKSVV